MPSPFFSIIIPTLNEAKYLPKLLTCLRKQTLNDFEVIIVDAHSADATLASAEKFRSKIPSLILATTPQPSVASQRNWGAKRARGKILLFIDADTQLPSFYLEGIKYRLSRTPTDVFTTWLKPDTNHPQDKAIAIIISLGFEIGKIIDQPGGMGAMLGISKSAFHQIGGFDPKLQPHEDQDLIRRAVDQDLNFTIFRDPIYTYSFRRFRQAGTLGILRQYAQVEKQFLLKGRLKQPEKDYPMGGHHFPPARTNSQ
jgi:glycosyltransferase involved in cell wall biosynthesis